MRKAFLILYDADGRRRLDSDIERTLGEERLAFEALKKTGLPPGVARAEYHDTDLGGRFLVIRQSPETIAAEPEQKKKSRKPL